MVVDLALCSSHTFFNHLVKGWISLAINRCHDRIKKAIELNEIVKGKISISTSAIDTCGFLMQVGEFWGHLDWPDPSVAYGLMITMLQQMCDCTQFYVRELHSAYESCDHSKEFYTTEEVCVCVCVCVVCVCVSLLLYSFPPSLPPSPTPFNTSAKQEILLTPPPSLPPAECGIEQCASHQDSGQTVSRETQPRELLQQVGPRHVRRCTTGDQRQAGGDQAAE